MRVPLLVVLLAGIAFATTPAVTLDPGWRAPHLVCDCARAECLKCSHSQLVSGERLARCSVRQVQLQRWDDFARLRIRAVFRAKKWANRIEAYAPIEPSTLFVPMQGRIQGGGRTLVASRRPARETRRRYLWTRRTPKDPFLLVRRSRGRFDLRAFPILSKRPSVVTIEGISLAPARWRGKLRFYRTGSRVLVVRDLKRHEGVRRREFFDVEGGRALTFLSLDEARLLHGRHADRAREVSFVHLLEEVAFTEGEGRTLLAALPADAPHPPSNPRP